MAYVAPPASTTPIQVTPGVSNAIHPPTTGAAAPGTPGSQGVNTTTGALGISVVGDSAGGFSGVGWQSPSGASPLTAALLPSDEAVALMTRWLLAWAVFGVLIIMLDRTRLGHAALYYALTLAIFFSVVVEYKWFARVLAPITGGVSINGPAKDTINRTTSTPPAEDTINRNASTGSGSGPSDASGPMTLPGDADLPDPNEFMQLLYL